MEIRIKEQSTRWPKTVPPKLMHSQSVALNDTPSAATQFGAWRFDFNWHGKHVRLGARIAGQCGCESCGYKSLVINGSQASKVGGAYAFNTCPWHSEVSFRLCKMNQRFRPRVSALAQLSIGTRQNAPKPFFIRNNNAMLF